LGNGFRIGQFLLTGFRFQNRMAKLQEKPPTDPQANWGLWVWQKTQTLPERYFITSTVGCGSTNDSNPVPVHLL
jgi:hypothetical protein